MESLDTGENWTPKNEHIVGFAAGFVTGMLFTLVITLAVLETIGVSV